MKEQWKNIPEYEGLYQVSNLGRVKSFRQSTKYGCQKEYILKPTIANNGYAQVTLYANARRQKFLVHRLVAVAFVPNPSNLPQINHKDENRLNNSASNLEWCTAAYNNAYGTARIRATDTLSKPIEQVDIHGRVLAVYRSARIASELLNCSLPAIRTAIRTHSQSRGCYWRYSDYPFK